MLRLTISAFCLLCTVAIVAASPAACFGAPLREMFQPPSTPIIRAVCSQVQMQGSDTLHREPLATGPVARAMKFAESVANSAKSLANHKLFRRAHTPPIPKEASMADQYMGWYTPEIKKQLEPIWKRGTGAATLNSTPRDLATADLSDTYSTPMHLQPATLVQALARSSELEYNEAVDMQGFPDSFL